MSRRSRKLKTIKITFAVHMNEPRKSRVVAEKQQTKWSRGQRLPCCLMFAHTWPKPPGADSLLQFPCTINCQSPSFSLIKTYLRIWALMLWQQKASTGLPSQDWAEEAVLGTAFPTLPLIIPNWKWNFAYIESDFSRTWGEQSRQQGSGGRAALGNFSPHD